MPCIMSPPNAIEKAVSRDIEAYRNADYDQFSKVDVSIRRLKHSRPRQHNAKVFGHYVLRIFDQPDEVLLVRLTSTEEMIILRNDKRTTAHDIMSSVPKHDPFQDVHAPLENRAKQASRMQRSWWTLNGRSFPFLELPAELRSEIYKHALPPTFYISHDQRKVRGHYRDWFGLDPWNACSLTRDMGFAISATNRQIREEVQEFAFRECSMDLPYLPFSLRAASQNCYQRINHLHLHFGPGAFADYFGCAQGRDKIIDCEPFDMFRTLSPSSVRITLPYITFGLDDTPGFCAPDQRFCRECREFTMIWRCWPALRGHACTFSGFDLSSHPSVVKAITQARRQYLDWQTNVSSSDKSLAAWDKWMLEFNDVTKSELVFPYGSSKSIDCQLESRLQPFLRDAPLPAEPCPHGCSIFFRRGE